MTLGRILFYRYTLGTYGVIYKLRNPNPQAMKLVPLLARAKTAANLDLNADICPTIEQSANFLRQLQSYVVRVLCRYHRDFKHYLEIPILQNVPRWRMPDGHKTKQFPLRITTIDKSTTVGNIAVHHDTYITQLKLTYKDLSDMAIPSINDQSTNARIRGAKALHAQDVNPFTRVQCFQLGFGLFHLCLNLIWALLHVHRGHINRVGSLSHWFAILEKTRLGNAHPNYHSLLAAFMQILDGLILDAW